MLWLQRRSSGRWTFLVEILSSCRGRGGCRWHFLAPLVLCHSPCGFLYNLLCLSAKDTITSSVFLLWWLLIVVMRYPQSPNRNQQASRPVRIPQIFLVFAVPYIVFWFSILVFELWIFSNPPWVSRIFYKFVGLPTNATMFSANFKNVLTICWYLLTSTFLPQRCTASEYLDFW